MINKWGAIVEANGCMYHIEMKCRFSAAVGEHLFDIEISGDDETDSISNYINIYSKKDAETWIRQTLKCPRKRFVWREVK